VDDARGAPAAEVVVPSGALTEEDADRDRGRDRGRHDDADPRQELER
jgi:hypothetical protein